MSGDRPDQRTCMHCGELFPWERDGCPHCGTHQAIPPKLNVWGLGFMQNRLRKMVFEGELAEPVAYRLIALLRQEQLAVLGKGPPVHAAERAVSPPQAVTPPEPALESVAPSVSVGATAAADAVPAPRPPGALDGALAGPNLLLYLGAFLIAVSGLILVAITPEDLSAQLKILLGIGGTFGFLIAGVRLHPIDAVRPAARTFLVLGAVLVPLDVWSIGTLAFDADHAARRHLLLVGSALSAGLYASLAVRGYGAHFAYLTAAALIGAAEGSVRSLGLDASWRGVPHLALASTSLFAAGSMRSELALLRAPLVRIGALIEVYAATILALVVLRMLSSLAIDVPNLAVASAFAAVARTRVDPARITPWSWLACGAGGLAAFGLIPRDAAPAVRVAGLLAISFALWIVPLRSAPLRWALAPGRATGWVAAAAALYLGFTSEPAVRALALAGVTAPLAYVASTLERGSARAGATARWNLLGALAGSYLLWISGLQMAGLLPAALGRDAATALAWSTFVAFVLLWAAAIRLGHSAHPWSRELRGAAHVAAAAVVVLAAPVPKWRAASDLVAVGPTFGVLLGASAAAYAVAIRQRRLPESAGLVVALGAGAMVGAVEAWLGGLTYLAILLPGLFGTLSLASLTFVPWPSSLSVRIGGIAAIAVAVGVFVIYRPVHASGVELAAALIALLASVLTAYAMPQVERAHRWAVPAALILAAFLIARTATDRRAFDPQIAALPFVLVLAIPAILQLVRRRPTSDESRALLLGGVLAASMSAATSLARYGPLWSPAVVAVEIALFALLAVRSRDQAIAGAPVMLAALAAETSIRHLRWNDLLVQGLVYGSVALGSARLLAHPGLLVDAATVRALYAVGVALLTLPATARALTPDGWWAIVYLAVLSATLLTAALRMRDRTVGVVGSLAALVALLAAFHQARAAETLIYTTTVGLYLTGLGLFMARTRFRPDIVTRDVLSLIRWGGPLLLLIPAVVRSWEGPLYGVVFFGLFGLVLAGGLLLRQRSMLGAAAGALGLETIWVVTTVARLLPFWMLFGLAGLTLLAAGTLLVLRRDLLERAQDRLQAQWELAD